MKAGERVNSDHDKQLHKEACKKYRACKQRKERQFKQKCFLEIEKITQSNPSDLCSFIDRIKPVNNDINTPSGEEFYNHFNNLAKPVETNDFDYEYEKTAKIFLDKYDSEKRALCNVLDELCGFHDK